jgi:hypothetical protein
MNAIPIGHAVGKPGSPDESRTDGSVENAWLVLEAANDLRDHVTVEICRRVIDASLNGRPAAASDLQILQNYFS